MIMNVTVLTSHNNDNRVLSTTERPEIQTVTDFDTCYLYSIYASLIFITLVPVPLRLTTLFLS